MKYSISGIPFVIN